MIFRNCNWAIHNKMWILINLDNVRSNTSLDISNLDMSQKCAYIICKLPIFHRLLLYKLDRNLSCSIYMSELRTALIAVIYNCFKISNKNFPIFRTRDIYLLRIIGNWIVKCTHWVSFFFLTKYPKRLLIKP